MRPEQERLLRLLALNDEATVSAVVGASLTAQDTPALDDKTRALVRLAGLIALEAAPASYQWGVASAVAAGATDEEIVGVLVAVAPVVGMVRAGSAAPALALAVGCDLEQRP